MRVLKDIMEKKAVSIHEAAINSISSYMSVKSLELKHTIKLLEELTLEIDEIEKEIKSIIDKLNSPILTIPGIGYSLGAQIIAEIGDFKNFDSPDKICFIKIIPSQLINQVNCILPMPKWKNEVQNI